MGKKQVVFSGIQPTGQLTIGHYISVLSRLFNFQKKFKCFFCIADLHSVTINVNSILLKKNIYDLVSVLLASGIDDKKCIIFLQSNIVEHSQLYWILNCYTYLGELNRMTQYKEKSNNVKMLKNCGLFTYPVLMAADILLYETDYVLIGDDQIQHVEFVRNIAKRFNNFFLCNVFKIPEYIIIKNKSRIMSLLDPKKKMSKSDFNKNNLILLLDNISTLKYKIKNSVTDSDNPPKIIYDMVNKPGVSNLLNILSSITNTSILDLEKKFIDFKYNDFKNVISEEIINFISIFQEKYYYFRNREKFLEEILLKGFYKSSKISKNILNKVNSFIGLNFNR